VTSPLASNFKRMLSETDPEKQAADKAGIFASAETRHDISRAPALSEMILGTPMPVRRPANV